MTTQNKASMFSHQYFIDKKLEAQGYMGGSGAKSTCSCGRPGLNSQNSHGDL